MPDGLSGLCLLFALVLGGGGGFGGVGGCVGRRGLGSVALLALLALLALARSFQRSAGELVLPLVSLSAEPRAAAGRALGGRLLRAQLQQHQAPRVADAV